MEAASCAGATKPSPLLRNAGHFPRFYPPLPCLHRDKEMRQDSSAARGIPGSTRSVTKREGRCPRAEVQQGTGQAAWAEHGEPGSHPEFFQKLGIQHSFALSPRKNDSQRLSKLPMIPLQTPSRNGGHIYDSVCCIQVCLGHPTSSGTKFPIWLPVKQDFIQPVLWTWRLGCGTSVPIYPFLTSHYLKQPSLQQRYGLKLTEMYNYMCLNVQLYVFKLSSTQVSFAAQITVCILLMSY